MVQTSNISTAGLNPGVSLQIQKCSSAVLAWNLSKRYKNCQPVFENFSMRVETGIIYSLLGSSGSGKTTLLSCMVGLQQYNSGELLVLGEKPGMHINQTLGRRLGYMPQDASLYDQLSIQEILRFYGRLYGMSYSRIEERWEFLNELLEFPENMGIIHNLSGGQRRRASMALAMVHNPELLVLDEPTVGLDPLLRNKIWSYLHQLLEAKNTTIIITTHYIEEARNSNMIGVLRNGRLIIEDSPATLLCMYNCELLEDVVLRVCRENENHLQSFPKSFQNWNLTKHVALKRKNPMQNEPGNCVKENSELTLSNSKCSKIWHSAQNIQGLTRVMTLTLIRHPLFLLMLMLLPTFQCGVGLIAVSSPFKYLHLGIVNTDLPNWKIDCGLIQELEASCSLRAINCLLLSSLTNNDIFILKEYNDEEHALQEARKGKIRGYLSFPDNYSHHIESFAIEKLFATNETLEGTRIRFRLDHSEFLIVYHVIKHLYLSYLEYTNKLAVLCGMSSEQLELPMQYRKPVYGNNNDEYKYYIICGGIVMALFALPMILSALIFIADYKKGTLSRARIAGLNITDILVSHFVVQLVITLLQTGILTCVNYFAFGLLINGSLLSYLLICLLTGVLATQIGLFLGIVFQDEVEVFYFVMSVYLILSQLAGTCTPPELSGWFWQQLGYLMSPKLPISAMRSVMIRGLGVEHALVWPGFVVLGIWTALFIAATMIAFKALQL